MAQNGNKVTQMTAIVRASPIIRMPWLFILLSVTRCTSKAWPSFMSIRCAASNRSANRRHVAGCDGQTRQPELFVCQLRGMLQVLFIDNDRDLDFGR